MIFMFILGHALVSAISLISEWDPSLFPSSWNIVSIKQSNRMNIVQLTHVKRENSI